jgi:hypothetical protein
MAERIREHAVEDLAATAQVFTVDVQRLFTACRTDLDNRRCTGLGWRAARARQDWPRAAEPYSAGTPANF